MYIGRIVSVARTQDGRLCAAYRVSSRSFPNRTAVIGENKISIVPKEGHESDIHKNPYIAYNCVRIVAEGEVAVVTNGSQTDPIAEKIDLGLPVRDALAITSLALDFEKDQYDTPRVSCVADAREDSLWLAVVRRDGIEVRQTALEPGHYAYVATYEENQLSPTLGGAYDASDADGACEFMFSGGVFKDREKPVTAVAAMRGPSGFELATRDAEPE